MSEAVGIARTENETSAKLERILPELVLPVTRGAGAIARQFIVGAKNVQKGSASKFGRAIGLALGVDEKRKADAGVRAKELGVMHIAQANGRELDALGTKLLFAFAQLRDVFAAEDSAVVAKKNDHGGVAFPKGSQANGVAGGIGQGDGRKTRAQCARHGAPFSASDSGVSSEVRIARGKHMEHHFAEDAASERGASAMPARVARMACS
jgi:hypothetical protein